MFEWRGYPGYSSIARGVNYPSRYTEESDKEYDRRKKKKKKSDVQKIIEELFGEDPGDPASTERALESNYPEMFVDTGWGAGPAGQGAGSGQPSGKPLDLAFAYRSDPGYIDPYVNQMWENIRQKHDFLMKGKLREWMIPRGGL